MYSAYSTYWRGQVDRVPFSIWLGCRVGRLFQVSATRSRDCMSCRLVIMERGLGERSTHPRTSLPKRNGMRCWSIQLSDGDLTQPVDKTYSS